MDINKLTRKEVVGIISFAVANNPKGVAQGLAANGFVMDGLDVQAFDDVLILAHENGVDLNWLLSVPYIHTVNNWTDKIGNQYQAENPNNAKGINWGTIGSIALGALPLILGAVTGMPMGSGTPPPAPDHTQEILGLQKEIFYGLMVVAIIILALIIYVIAKK